LLILIGRRGRRLLGEQSCLVRTESTADEDDDCDDGDDQTLTALFRLAGFVTLVLAANGAARARDRRAFDALHTCAAATSHSLAARRLLFSRRLGFRFSLGGNRFL